MAAAVNGNGNGNGNGNSWGYMDDRGGAYPQQQRQRSDTNNDGPRSLSSQGARRRTSDFDMRSDNEHPTARRTASRTGATSAMKKRSKDKLREKLNAPIPSQGQDDDSKWIHRDKLAQIEIREMEEAGFFVGRSRRAASTEPGEHGRTSRSTSRRRRAEADEYDHDQYDEFGRKRMSTIPGEEEEHYDRDGYRETDYDGAMASSSAEEASLAKSTPSRGHKIRPSTSRIPVVKNGTSPPSTGDANQPRNRSDSAGSQAILDDLVGSKTTPPSSSGKRDASPPKGSASKRTATGPGGAARPGSSQGNKARQPSGSASKRPGSSSGHQSRPSTSHRTPEGDPPWFGSMFKPDPRLPPDQQMLPTHAKRLMQEQWAKEGKPSTVYDRDFNQLTDDELRNMIPPTGTSKIPLDSPLRSPVMEVPEPAAELNRSTRTPSPSKHFNGAISPSPEKNDAASLRPGTSGGYRITPTITATPPVLPSPRNSNLPPHHRSTEAGVQSPPPPRVPDLDEKQEAEPKKGCCCVMM